VLISDLLVQSNQTVRSSRIRVRVSIFTVIYGPALILMAFSVLASVLTDISLTFFLSDPATTLGEHPVVGLQSNIGVSMWCATAAICLFSGAIVRFTPRAKSLSVFLLYGGVLTSVLFFDDFFLIHEDLASRYLSVDEKIILVGYGLAALYLVRFRDHILDSDYLFLLIALLFLGLSALTDILHQFFYDQWNGSWVVFFEEGFKLLGIVSWTGYWVRTCFRAIVCASEDKASRS
jgi:hypothetical protein